MTLTTLNRAGIAVVGLRLPVLVLHSLAHSELQIYVSPWQNVYILFVIIILPLVCTFLLWRHSRFGFLLLFISMFGSLIFGGYYHFIAAGPDNVGELGHHTWTFPFQLSAVLLAVIEAVGALVGIVGLTRTSNRIQS